MSLIGALNVGQTGLATAQAAIQVTSNNISNAANPDYTRESAQTSPLPDQQLSQGVFIGTGVDLTSVQRQIDDALDARLRGSISDNQAASTTQQWLSQVQSVFNALGSSNLSTAMNNFFSAWANLANKPQDTGLRQVVLQQGQSLAQTFNSQVTQLESLNSSASSSLTQLAQNADNLASQIANLNGQIVVAQGGSGGTANALLDQRDAVLKQLSQLMNVTTVPQANGAMDVYVGSEALVSNTISNGVTVANQNVNGTVTPTVVFKSNNAAIPLGGGGQLGAITGVQARITGVVAQENNLAHNLIFELNKLHSSGQGLQGISSVTARGR